MKSRPDPTLSVCMIVRNEEDALPRCLASVKGLADEIVVVDTGSTDRTKEIAGRCGARVLSEPWRDDFAAARNVSLAAATGAWILWLDADDIVPQQSHQALRALTTEKPDRVFALWVRNEKPGGTGSDFVQARMFPNRPDIRFERRIHEQMTPSALRAGLKLVRRDVLIEHHGYADPADVNRKSRRNIALLLEEYRFSGPDAVMAVELADSYLMIGDNDNAEKWFRAALAVAGVDTTAPEIASHANLGLGKVLNDRKRFAEAADSLGRALAICPGRPDALYSMAVTRENLGEIDAALEALRAIIDTHVKPLFVSVDFREAAIKAYLRMERLLCGAGRIDDARVKALEALRRFPHRPEMHSMNGRALFRAGRFMESLHAFEASLKEAAQGNLDAHIGLCHVYSVAGRPEHVRTTIDNLRPHFESVPRFRALCRLFAPAGERAGTEDVDEEEVYLRQVFTRPK